MADVTLTGNAGTARAWGGLATLSVDVKACITLMFTQAAYYEYVEAMAHWYGYVNGSSESEYDFAKRMLIAVMNECVKRYRYYEADATVDTTDASIT